MAKYSQRIVKDICQLIVKDSYTIPEICKMVGISPETYHAWARSKPDFLQAIKKARGEYDEMIVSEAKKSLLKRIRGYTENEVKTIQEPGLNGKPIIKQQTNTKKHYQPDVTALIFVLTNKAPEEYKHRSSTEAKVEISKIDSLEGENLNAVIDRVLNENNKS